MSTEVKEEVTESAETIITNYKMMTAEAQQLASKISDLSLDRDEHKLVLDNLKGLEPSRKAFRLIGGVLVQRTVKEVFPEIKQNYENLLELIQKLDASLKIKDSERRAYKDKHGIMTQEERDARLKAQAQAAARS